MWTESLQQQTRDHFENVLPVVAMKHFGDDKFGFCIFKDERYTIKDRKPESNMIWEYTSIEELIFDGWAIDQNQ